MAMRCALGRVLVVARVPPQTVDAKKEHAMYIGGGLLLVIIIVILLVFFLRR
jgi:hypothetical protein